MNRSIDLAEVRRRDGVRPTYAEQRLQDALDTLDWLITYAPSRRERDALVRVRASILALR